VSGSVLASCEVTFGARRRKVTDPDDPLDAVEAGCGGATGSPPTACASDSPGAASTATAVARLTTRSRGTIIAARAAAAGLDGDIGGHSLRLGFATSALAGGASERAVQRHSRWRSLASMAGYIDEAHRFDDTNPTRYLRG